MTSAPDPRTIADLVFVGLNRRVLALDRYDGRLVWEWRAPSGSGLVSLLLDGDRLIASVSGYTYCLDPLLGGLVWTNELRGYGLGIATLASARGHTDMEAPAAVLAARQAAQAAAATPPAV